MLRLNVLALMFFLPFLGFEKLKETKEDKLPRPAVKPREPIDPPKDQRDAEIRAGKTPGVSQPYQLEKGRECTGGVCKIEKSPPSK